VTAYLAHIFVIRPLPGAPASPQPVKRAVLRPPCHSSRSTRLNFLSSSSDQLLVTSIQQTIPNLPPVSLSACTSSCALRFSRFNASPFHTAAVFIALRSPCILYSSSAHIPQSSPQLSRWLLTTGLTTRMPTVPPRMTSSKPPRT
jgi:hypothetical protein